jgi:hypothetical protein
MTARVEVYHAKCGGCGCRECGQNGYTLEDVEPDEDPGETPAEEHEREAAEFGGIE